jgi:hypothetical protein
MNGRDLIVIGRHHPFLVVCCSLTLGLAAAIYFRSGVIPEAEAQLAQKTAEADKHASNASNAAQLKEQLAALVAANKEIDSRVVRAGQLGVNYQYFYKIIAESGVKQVDLRQITVTAAAASKASKAGFIPVAFTVAIQGEFRQVLHFLRLLESGAHYCRVTGATFSQVAGDRSGAISLVLNLELLGQP